MVGDDFSLSFMEGVLRLFWSKFHLEDPYGMKIEISNVETKRLRCSKFFLVGKVLARKTPRVSVVMGLFLDLWRPKANVNVMAIGDNQILFSFNTEEEVRCMLRGSLWFFCKSLLLLAEVKGLDVSVHVLLGE